MRRSIRLSTYDYSRPGVYFVTILTHRRAPLLGAIVGSHMRESAAGRIVRDVWESLPGRYPTVRLDAFVVMPDHVHAVVVIAHGESAESPAPQSPRPASDAQTDRTRRRRMLLPLVIGYWKAGAARHINRLRGTPGVPVWQRNYYERIVRDQRELGCVRRYIESNPAQSRAYSNQYARPCEGAYAAHTSK